MTDFSAGPQAAGYFYQARHALLIVLSGPDDLELVVEGLDDIQTTSAQRQTLSQLKHHIGRVAQLTDSSADLWKTLKVWSTYKADGRIVPQTALVLVTTSLAPPGSAASFLRPDPKRDEKAALRLLRSAAGKSKSKNLASAFSAFASLSGAQQEDLISIVQVIDASPNLTNIVAEIRKWVRNATHPDFVDAVLERLEGWWFAQVADQLTGARHGPISGVEVRIRLNAIAEEYRADHLPIEFLTALPPSIDVGGDSRQFVRQVREVTDHPIRIEKAIIDYYRAYEQRSRWLREDLLLQADLDDYESRLVDEWQRIRASLEDEGNPASADNDACVKFGRKMLKWVESEADVRIRDRVTEGYVMRGSYHLLADQPEPRVWWHPYFVRRLQELTADGKA